jgi:hypothetical protein
VIDKEERMFYAGLVVVAALVGFIVYVVNGAESERNRIKLLQDAERPLKLWEKERAK